MEWFAVVGWTSLGLAATVYVAVKVMRRRVSTDHFNGKRFAQRRVFLATDMQPAYRYVQQVEDSINECAKAKGLLGGYIPRKERKNLDIEIKRLKSIRDAVIERIDADHETYQFFEPFLAVRIEEEHALWIDYVNEINYVIDRYLALSESPQKADSFR